MEIFEFLFGCLEMLAAWRSALMVFVGIFLSFMVLAWLGTNLPGFIVAGMVFAGCCIRGHYWQRASERGRFR